MQNSRGCEKIMKKKKGIVHPTRALRGVAPTVHECLHVWGSNANNAGLFCTVVVAGSVELMQMVQVQMATATTGGRESPPPPWGPPPAMAGPCWRWLRIQVYCFRIAQIRSMQLRYSQIRDG